MKIGKEMFWETFMPGLTAWLEVVWSATVPWNLRGCISSSFPTSKCCTNSLCRGIFPHIVTCQLLVTRTMLSPRVQCLISELNSVSAERVSVIMSIYRWEVWGKGRQKTWPNLVMQPSFPASALFLQSLVLSTLVSPLETKGFWTLF